MPFLSPARPDQPPAERDPRGSAQAFALHGAVLLFGLSGLFAKWVSAHPVLIVTARVAVASAAFALLLRLRRLPGARPRGAQREAQWASGALWAGGALLALHWIAFFQAIQGSTVALGLLGYATAPVFAAVLEPPLLRERYSAQTLWAALVCAAGVALLVPFTGAGSGGAFALHGVAWGVLSGLSFAALSILNRHLVRTLPALRVAYHQDLAALVLLAPLLPWVWQPLSVAELALLGVLGLVCTALAHALFIWALTGFPARSATIVSALEPVYGIALAWLLLGEAPAARTLAGGALILAAVLFATRRAAA